MRRWVLAGACVCLLSCVGGASSLDGGATGGGSAGGGEAVDSGTTGGGSSGGGSSGGGATGGGSATGGGGAADAGPTADAGAGCPADAVFCESFEGALDGARWKINGTAAAFTIDTTTPAREGSGSLHLTYGAPSGHTGQQSIQIKPSLAAPGDRVYLRTYMRFGDLSLPGAHPFFIDVADSSGTEVGFGSIINDFSFMAFAPGGLDNARIWYEGGGNQWHPGVEDGDATPLTENGLAAKTWVCVELMLFGDHQSAGDTMHPNEEAKVWINGTEVPQLGATDALWKLELGRDPPEHWSPRYDGATWRFGVESFGPRNVALDLWFDALVIGPTRIGCL